MSKRQNRARGSKSDPLRLASEPQVPQALFILHSTPREKGRELANSRPGTSALCRSFGAHVNEEELH